MLKRVCVTYCILLYAYADSHAALRFVLPQITVIVGPNQAATGFIDVTIRADASDLPQSVGSFNVDFKTTSPAVSFGIPQTPINPLIAGAPQNFSPNSQTSRAARDIFPSSVALTDSAGLVRVPFQLPVGVTGEFPLMFGSFNQLTNSSASPLSLQILDVGSITVALAVPGDYNRNGIVDAADYVLYRDSINKSGPGLAADGNGNQQIDTGDYGIWRSNFGLMSTGSGIGASTSVPEPITPILWILAGILARVRLYSK